MILLQLVLNLGDNHYEGGQGKSVLEILTPFIAVLLSGTISYWIASSSFKKSTLKEKEKEENRLKLEREKEQSRMNDVRMIFFNFLINLYKSINNQVKSLDLAALQIESDLEGETKNSELVKALMLADLDSNRIFSINMEDVFKILVVNGDDNKQKRQQIFTNFYGIEALLGKIAPSLLGFGTEMQDSRISYIKLINEKKFVIDGILREQHQLHLKDIQAHNSTNNKYLDEILNIFQNKSNPKELVDIILSGYLTPIKTISVKSEYLKDNVLAKDIAHKITEIEGLHKEILKQKRIQLESFQSWILNFKEVLVTLNTIIVIEYSKEFIPDTIVADKLKFNLNNRSVEME